MTFTFSSSTRITRTRNSSSARTNTSWAACRGGKRALSLLRTFMAASGEESVDAKTILALFLARDKQYPEAIQIISGLYSDFPHNFIFGLAQADLLHASGQHEKAIAAYRKLVELAQQGFFPDARAERAALSLGNALRDQKDYAG